MLNRLYLAIALACAVSFASPAAAQSNPNLTKGQVLTAGQWNALFAGKQDTLGFVPASTAGATFTGRLVTAASSASLSGFNITPGGVPASPANGDMWMTSAGLFARVNGVTVGPISGGSSSSFAATAPLNVSFPSGVVTYACATCGVTSSPLSQFASTTSAQLLGVISDETGSGSLVFATSPTLITPTLGVATATSINKVAITAPATSATLTIANGKTLTANNSLAFSGTDGTVFTFPGSSDTVVTLTAAQSLSSKTLVSPVITTSFTATGLVKNADLVNPSTTVNGQTCTLGASCTVTAAATSVTIGTTAISGGTTTRVLYDNAGVIGEYSISGTGSVAMTTSPTFVTPTLGAATGTSLALGGCTIGTNVLCATGTAAISGTLTSAAHTVTSAAAGALAVGLNGATNPAFVVDASTASSATGISVKSAAAAGGVAIAAISSGTNEAMSINAKGSGAIAIGGTSTGGIALGAGGGGVTATALTVNTSFTATGLVGYAALQTAAIATSSEYLAGTASKLVQSGAIYPSETTTTFGATTSFDFATFINTAVTLTGNITTMNVSNVKAGQSGMITLIQDGTGSRTTVWNAIFKFAGGLAPTLSTTSGAIDVLTYSCRSATFCVAALNKDVK